MLPILLDWFSISLIVVWCGLCLLLCVMVFDVFIWENDSFQIKRLLKIQSKVLTEEQIDWLKALRVIGDLNIKRIGPRRLFNKYELQSYTFSLDPEWTRLQDYHWDFVSYNETTSNLIKYKLLYL